MIKLTRLNKEPMWLNPDLFEAIEETPDTVITLVDGKKVLVCEPAEVVSDKITVYRASVLMIVSRLESANPTDARNAGDAETTGGGGGSR